VDRHDRQVVALQQGASTEQVVSALEDVMSPNDELLKMTVFTGSL
jgi:hypothetical protein